jgi:hypothetical protein
LVVERGTLILRERGWEGSQFGRGYRRCGTIGIYVLFSKVLESVFVNV